MPLKHLARFAISFILFLGISYLIDLIEALFTGVMSATRPQSTLTVSTLIAIMLTAMGKFPEKLRPKSNR